MMMKEKDSAPQTSPLLPSPPSKYLFPLPKGTKPLPPPAALLRRFCFRLGLFFPFQTFFPLFIFSSERFLNGQNGWGRGGLNGDGFGSGGGGEGGVPNAGAGAGRTQSENKTWDTGKMHVVRRAHEKLSDADERWFFDQPCEWVFGGAMCKRTRKNGDMSIEMAS